MGHNNFGVYGKRKEIKKPPETDIYIDDKGLDKC